MKSSIYFNDEKSLFLFFFVLRRKTENKSFFISHFTFLLYIFFCARWFLYHLTNTLNFDTIFFLISFNTETSYNAEAFQSDLFMENNFLNNFHVVVATFSMLLFLIFFSFLPLEENTWNKIENPFPHSS